MQRTQDARSAISAIVLAPLVADPVGDAFHHDPSQVFGGVAIRAIARPLVVPEEVMRQRLEMARRELRAQNLIYEA